MAAGNSSVDVTDWGNFQGRRRQTFVSVKETLKRLEVSFQTFAEDQLLGMCWANVFLVAIAISGSVCYKEATFLKKKKTKQRGDMDTLKWETDLLFEAISCKKCCDFLNEWKYINAYKDGYPEEQRKWGKSEE